ncbi:ferredoxin reductase family protein [Ruegeria arenilitoris]|uniref:ferredoxin reductase family protein n=1 Tax=Ruegeria arenilitoris TaxID=1173585 RepID=UPI00147D37A2
MKPIFLIIGYAITVVLPLILSWIFGGPPRPFHQELASGFGMLAFSIILVEFVLSGRFKIISNGLGMDVTMRAHQLLARTALAFAFIHPFLYGGTPSGGPRPWDPTRQLTITTEFAYLSTGIAAFLLLFCLVFLAIGRKKLDFKYETWRLIHGLGALMIAVLLLHHTVYAGRYGSQPELTWFWLVMTGAALGSLLYIYLAVPLRDMGRVWRVKSVTSLTPNQWEITVAPQNHSGLEYKAGQFVWLNVGHGPFSINENPFSICSAPANGPSISFMIKELGDFSRAVGGTKLETVAYIDGPYGSLSIDDRDEPGVALIAGGVGVAPLLGILREMRASGDPRQVKMVYGNKRFDQIAWRDELGKEDITYVLSEPPEGWEGEEGLIDAEIIDRVFSLDQFRSWVFVLCGPSNMMETIEDHLIKKGTPWHRILSERFDYD